MVYFVKYNLIFITNVCSTKNDEACYLKEKDCRNVFCHSGSSQKYFFAKRLLFIFMCANYKIYGLVKEKKINSISPYMLFRIFSSFP